jgi:hypothetical protein
MHTLNSMGDPGQDAPAAEDDRKDAGAAGARAPGRAGATDTTPSSSNAQQQQRLTLPSLRTMMTVQQGEFCPVLVCSLAVDPFGQTRADLTVCVCALLKSCRRIFRHFKYDYLCRKQRRCSFFFFFFVSTNSPTYCFLVLVSGSAFRRAQLCSRSPSKTV